MKLKIKDQIPNTEIFQLIDGEPQKKKLKGVIGNGKIVLFGLPGAYTSVCSAKHLPGYIKMHDQFKEKGIDHIICISVNDPFVMNAWGKQNDVGEKIVMMGDPFLNFTKEIGADTVEYVSVPGLVKCIGKSEDDLCLGCITEKYPLPIEGERQRGQATLEEFEA